ncbi:hypothetical protein PsaNZ64_00190 [Pseudomonas syringae pv. actinidiae]|nr:hypothetical protein PsaNZ64_00190 [Pseudomonas syringae pv. actinidiae]
MFFLWIASLSAGILCTQADAETKSAPRSTPAPTFNQPKAPVRPQLKSPQQAVPKPPQAIPSQGRFGSSTWNQVEAVPAGTTRFGSPPLDPPMKGQTP